MKQADLDNLPMNVQARYKDLIDVQGTAGNIVPAEAGPYIVYILSVCKALGFDQSQGERELIEQVPYIVQSLWEHYVTPQVPLLLPALHAATCPTLWLFVHFGNPHVYTDEEKARSAYRNTVLEDLDGKMAKAYFRKYCDEQDMGKLYHAHCVYYCNGITKLIKTTLF